MGLRTSWLLLLRATAAVRAVARRGGGHSPAEGNRSVATADSRALAGLVAAAALALVACGGESGPSGPTATPAAPVDSELVVRASEWRFEPKSIVLQQGQEVRIVLENGGTILHNLKADGLEVDVIESVNTGGLSGEEDELFVGADAGDVGTISFVPLEAGSYDVFCTIPNHRQLGMEGTLVVE